MTDRKLTNDQQVGIDKINAWVSKPNDPYMLLAGYAGTGKTYIMSLLASNPNVIFTAPTNKATKELSKPINKPAVTTFSCFGLRMEQVGEELILSPGPTAPYFSRGTIVVIDEGSMVNQILFDTVDKARFRSGVKILYVGDPMQLPPVNEQFSKVWRLGLPEENTAVLREVVRHDNQILTLATKTRVNIKQENYESPLISDNDGIEGVWKHRNKEQFEADMMETILGDVHNSKFIAWRNRTVNEVNNKVRIALGFKDEYNVGDILLVAEPVRSGDDTLAHIDDEFVVQDIEHDDVEVDGHRIPVYLLNVKNSEKSILLKIAKSEIILDEILSKRARLAKNTSDSDKRRQMWQSFWQLKEKFQKVRYGYALTTHRMQGSTCKNVFVDQQDVLANRNELEAMKCLYVGFTRPTTRLVSY